MRRCCHGWLSQPCASPCGHCLKFRPCFGALPFLACNLACFGLEKYSYVLKAPWGSEAAVFVCTSLLANQKPQLWPPAIQYVPRHIFLAHFQAKCTQQPTWKAACSATLQSKAPAFCMWLRISPKKLFDAVCPPNLGLCLPFMAGANLPLY